MDETIKDIEIALRDGMIDELVSTTETGLDIIRRLADVVAKQDDAIIGWELMAGQLRDVAIDLNGLRERAVELSVRLLDECMSCSNREHHGPAY
jgi:hypothetical protein